jgi:hypothetical protein
MMLHRHFEQKFSEEKPEKERTAKVAEAKSEVASEQAPAQASRRGRKKKEE